MRIIFSFFLIGVISSCTSKSLNRELPIIYLGVDTTYDKRPVEQYCIHNNVLSIFSKDSVTLSLSSIPFAPIDSPYNLHASSVVYRGQCNSYDNNNITIEWNKDIELNWPEENYGFSKKIKIPIKEKKFI